jgi:hypothetical protein
VARHVIERARLLQRAARSALSLERAGLAVGGLAAWHGACPAELDQAMSLERAGVDGRAGRSPGRRDRRCGVLPRRPTAAKVIQMGSGPDGSLEGREGVLLSLNL